MREEKKLPATNAAKFWKRSLLKFLLYLAVGFLCAFLYNQFKK